MQFCYFAQVRCASQWTHLKRREISHHIWTLDLPSFSDDTTNSKVHVGIWRCFNLNFTHMQFCYFAQFRRASQWTHLKCRQILHHTWTLDLLSFPMIPQNQKSTLGIWRYLNLNFTHIMRFCYFAQDRCAFQRTHLKLASDITPYMDARPRQLSNDTTNSKIQGGNLEIFHFKMALDITPCLNTRPPQYSNDITNSKIHLVNLEICQLELHISCDLAHVRCASQWTHLKWRQILHHIWKLDLPSFPMIPQIKKSTLAILRYFSLNFTHIM